MKEKNKRVIKSSVQVSDQVKNYGNEPFVLKKVRESKTFLEKHGFPKELTLEK